MFHRIIISCLALAIIPLIVTDDQTIRNRLERKTMFIFYDKANTEVFVSTSQDDDLEDAVFECHATKKYAMVIHGWHENCNTPWVVELRKNLIIHHGGCIICMDYSDYGSDYGYLVANFKTVAEILTDKLNVLKNLSFRSSDAFLFGFSYSSRLIARAGIDFGPREIGNIHLCEPAGPGFENTNTNPDARMAAKNAQCIHTASGGFGTRERKCHQNWNMGNCGESQVGRRPYPLGNHGLCPVFYNYAFTNVFPAVEKSKTCRFPLTERDALILPPDLRMGYYQNINNPENFTGVNLYAITTRNPPFN